MAGVPVLVLALVVGGAAATPEALSAQAGEGDPEEEAAVLGTVQELFDAMEERDPDRAARVLRPEGQFYRVGIPFDGVEEPSSLEEFAAMLAEDGPELLERMQDPEVRVHERIAVAWTPYDFFSDGEFSHCGVNAFHLIRDEERWRISGIVYTVEPDPEACPEGLGPRSLPPG